VTRYRLAPHWALNLAMLTVGWTANAVLTVVEWVRR
jgi:hypothetical protein